MSFTITQDTYQKVVYPALGNVQMKPELVSIDVTYTPIGMGEMSPTGDVTVFFETFVLIYKFGDFGPHLILLLKALAWKLIVLQKSMNSWLISLLFPTRISHCSERLLYSYLSYYHRGITKPLIFNR